MAPCGHLHFHPLSHNYSDDFSAAEPRLQAHFIHEMTHIWQSQVRGWWYLLVVGPFQRKYSYRLKPGKRFNDYNIEQQAEKLRADGFKGDVKILTSCPACLQGLSRYDDDADTQADYIVVEMAKHLLGDNWMADYVGKANSGGIERVLL